MAAHTGRRLNPGLSDRMSRSDMALIPHVSPSAAKVLTTDTKSTVAEAKIFNFLADAEFQAAWGAFLPTAWHRCAGFFIADVGWCPCNGV